MGVNALALHGPVFCVFVAALLRSITRQCWKTPVAKEGRKGRGELGRGGRKVLLLKQKHHLLLLHLLTKRQGGPLGCARTLPPVDGNEAEQGLPKNSCLETDPWYLLGLGEETLEVWALFFWTSNWTEKTFSPNMFKAKPYKAEIVCKQPQLSLRLQFSGLFRDLQIRKVLKPVALSFSAKAFDGMWHLADQFPGTIPCWWYFSIPDAVCGQSSLLGL